MEEGLFRVLRLQVFFVDLGRLGGFDEIKPEIVLKTLRGSDLEVLEPFWVVWCFSTIGGDS